MQLNQPSKKATYAKKPLLKVLVFFGILIIGFCLLEILARIFWSENIVMFPRYHTEAHYPPYTLRRIIPGIEFIHSSIDGRWTFKINNQGIRDYNDYSSLLSKTNEPDLKQG